MMLVIDWQTSWCNILFEGVAFYYDSSMTPLVLLIAVILVQHTYRGTSTPAYIHLFVLHIHSLIVLNSSESRMVPHC